MCSEPGGDGLRTWLGPHSATDSGPAAQGPAEGGRSASLGRDAGEWGGACRQDDDKVSGTILHWSNAGQILVNQWQDTGQILVKYLVKI